MKRLNEIFFKSTLARKQLLFILSISLFFTIIASSIQIWVEYKRDLKKIDNEFLIIQHTHLQTMASSLWEMNINLLKKHMDNILTLRHIIHIQVNYNHKEEITSGKILQDHEIITKEFPLVYNDYGKNINIGKVKITASMSEIYKETFNRAILIILLQSIQIFSVSLFIMIVIYHYFIKNLIRISRYSKNISLEDLESTQNIYLTRKKKSIKDELDELADSLNSMRERLKTELQNKDLAEHKLRENEEFLRITLNSIVDGVITTNLEGEVVSINPVAKSLTGFNEKNAPGKKIYEIFDIYNLTTGLKIPDPFKTALRFGKAADNFGRSLLKSKNGQEYIISFTAVPIFDDNSEKKGVVIVFRDLTSSHEKDIKLIEKEKNYRIIFEQSNASIIVVDPFTYRIIDCNRKTFELFQIEEDELERINFTDFFKNEKNIPDFANLTEKPEQYESELLSLNRNILYCMVNLQIIDHENQKRILAVITDISSIKKMQDKIIETQKMDSIGNLAGGIAHDFNNKLAGILGYASMLGEMEDRKDKKEIITNIIQSAQRSAEITKNLLGFARKGKNILEPCNLNIMAEDVVSIIKSGISSEKNISFNFNFADDLYSIDADPLQIKQAVMNICLNAVEAIEKNGEILIETKNINKSRVELSIKDSGSGIPEKIKSGIFEPFVTTKNNSEMTDGRGLGLPAVYGIIRNHNGSIEYSSREGKGTVFKLSFPKGFKQSQKIETLNYADGYDKKTILIIEDEEILRSMLENILQNYKFHVLKASNGQEGVEVFKQNKDIISAVILDMKMPVMNGKEAFVELKKIDSSVKVLISTGYGNNEEAQEILDLGAMELLTKPYQMKDLMDKLKKLIIT
ncbi:MAG: response regulator [Desulfobacteraceae bacterium]|nr:response regulator [Desulfobacteraceae bacterium]MCB9495208.1 response regulator [Desulfobacteraceae bacterium]